MFYNIFCSNFVAFLKKENIYRLKLSRNEKSIVFGYRCSNIGFACNNAQVQAEKAKQDSFAEAARLDSIAKVQTDSIKASITAAEEAAAAEVDNIGEIVEETVEEITAAVNE